MLTSRIIGYSICQLSVPAVHAEIAPFAPSDTANFLRKWRVAYEKAVKPEAPNLEMASKQAEELIKEIQERPHVASLAANPLMLTIIALIKQQGVRLPERRVELYEIALRTLMDAWDHARRMYQPKDAQRDSGSQTYDVSVTVWSRVAYWMHAQTNRGQASHDQLLQELTRALEEEDLGAHEARCTAESYLKAAKEVSGILQPEGPSTFSFLHQTFQEYLAAYYLAIPTNEAYDKLKPIRHDPRWHEVIRLAAGIIGVINKDGKSATTLVLRLAEGSDDALEPLFFRDLRLAAACCADDVGVRLNGQNTILVKLCKAIKSSHDFVATALGESVAHLPDFPPGEESIAALAEIADSTDWKIRREWRAGSGWS